jgi:hypothetical protein
MPIDDQGARIGEIPTELPERGRVDAEGLTWRVCALRTCMSQIMPAGNPRTGDESRKVEVIGAGGKGLNVFAKPEGPRSVHGRIRDVRPS